VQDLTLVTVADGAAFAHMAAAEARNAAEAERRDLAALAEEVRSGNDALMQQLLDSEGSGGSALASCVQKAQTESMAALRTLQAQASEQQAQLRALATRGLADAPLLSAKMDAIAASAAAAATSGAANAAALADELSMRHAEALAQMDCLVAGNSSISDAVRREAMQTRAAMQQSQQQLAQGLDARRREELAALDALIKGGSAAARSAAAELKESLGELRGVQELERAQLQAVARDTAQLKTVLGEVNVKADDILSGVEQVRHSPCLCATSPHLTPLQLKLMMAAMQLSNGSAAETPRQRQEKLLKAMSCCQARLTVSVRAGCSRRARIDMTCAPDGRGRRRTFARSTTAVTTRRYRAA